VSAKGTAFVAGATGYVGREVVRACREAGLRTVAHVRPDSRRLAAWSDRFTRLGAEVDTTPWAAEQMGATLRALKPTVVFALLGTTRARGRAASAEAKETYESVDYGLTSILLEAAASCGSDPRFVYLSTLLAGPRARGAYLEVRWRLEEQLRAGEMPYTIARPALVTGPDRDEIRRGEQLGAWFGDAALGLVGFVGARRLRDRFRSTTGAALAEALVRLALDPAAARRTFSGKDLR
jgi:nucleoside-diphosphate-sugar epimerase